MGGPLAGVRVVEAAAVVSAPFGTMLLADQGADVIKLESPEGGDITRRTPFGVSGLTALYVNCNRGKRSVAVDVHHPAGRAVVLDLAAGADVFVENYRCGVMDRLGLGETDLRKVNPDLIHVSVSGYGPDGPYSKARVYDPIIQGLSGHVAVQVNPNAPIPDLVRTIVCDKASALTMAEAVCAALFARERGAGGQHIHVPMLDAAIAFFWPDGMMAHTMLGEDVTRGWTLYEIYRLTETADGHIVYFTGGDKEFNDLLRALGREDVAADPMFSGIEARLANLEKLGALLVAEFKKWPTAEILKRLAAEGVASGPVLALEEVWEDPQVRHNGVVKVREHPVAGPIRQAGPAARFSATAPEETPLAPLLGEHTDAVLAELGYDANRIGQLRETGVIP